VNAGAQQRRQMRVTQAVKRHIQTRASDNRGKLFRRGARVDRLLRLSRCQLRGPVVSATLRKNRDLPRAAKDASQFARFLDL
jgi:hypothetical protein